jgi:XTP/dITP diphosphohydrolase
MKKIIVASNNNNKIIEIKKILAKYKIEVLSLKDYGIDIEVIEDGSTFMENAYKKAWEIYSLSNECMVLADDSGLSVEALDGAPGVYSARFAGEHGNYKKNNIKLLKMLENIPYEGRKAKFTCAMVLIEGKDKIVKVEGHIDGYIAFEEKGKDGFGYDPLFYLPEYKMTFAEMNSTLKNSISHRGNALKKLDEEFKKLNLEE